MYTDHDNDTEDALDHWQVWPAGMREYGSEDSHATTTVLGHCGFLIVLPVSLAPALKSFQGVAT